MEKLTSEAQGNRNFCVLYNLTNDLVAIDKNNKKIYRIQQALMEQEIIHDTSVTADNILIYLYLILAIASIFFSGI